MKAQLHVHVLLMCAALADSGNAQLPPPDNQRSATPGPAKLAIAVTRNIENNLAGPKPQIGFDARSGNSGAGLQSIVQPRIVSVACSVDSTAIEIAADTDFAHRVQASYNLVDWVNIGWVTGSSNGLLRFVDPDRQAHPMRFYRVVQTQVPRVRIAVFSDPHYMHPSLLISNGVAFQNYLVYDHKLLRESGAILDSTIESITSARPDIVLVPGDLTKDGELVGHQAVALALQRLRDAGSKVFVCPGNHDVANPQALAFEGSNVIPVPSISPAQFASIYSNCGYGDAIARDPGSLSYVAEPVAGLWVLAMDACRYDLNTNGASYTGGYFDAARWNWITNQLAFGRAQGMFVIGMVHHGVTEHFPGQKKLFPEYVLDEFETTGATFARFGMKVVFTGHYHAQDIARSDHPVGTLFDIETGSLVTYPNPFRVMDISANSVLDIKSFQIDRINYDLGGADFPSYSYNFLTNGFTSVAANLLIQPPYNLPQFAAQLLAPALAEAFTSHCLGDESSRPISPQTREIIEVFLGQEDPMVQWMGDVLLAFFRDPEPPDNTISINLITGEVLP